jgi:hypothetical protein
MHTIMAARNLIEQQAKRIYTSHCFVNLGSALSVKYISDSQKYLKRRPIEGSL